ncbi:MAG: hypothetical protein GX892_09460, partial [Thermoanaerobacteraceae bacterium]|nr:hypothetical protein [Thermoanaerobacteraceae bacterium]
RLDKVEDEPGKDKIKPLLPEETKKDEAFEEDSAGEENESKEEPAKEELPKDEQQSEATDNCCGTTIDSEQHDEKQNQ